MKLFLDENISPRVAKQLRDYSFDAVSVFDIKANGFSDEQQLETAINEKRAFVTYDLKDFINLAKDYIAKGKQHYGIILVSNKTISQREPSLLTSALRKLIENVRKDDDSLVNKIIFLMG